MTPTKRGDSRHPARILVLAKGYPPTDGGIETYSHQVAEAYARAGHDVTVVTSAPGPVVTSRSTDGVTVHNVGRGSQVRVLVRMVRRLYHLRRSGWVMVHATTWRVAIPARLVLGSHQLVVTVHGREVFMAPRPLRPVMLSVLQRARLVPVVSRPIMDQFESQMGARLPHMLVCWNGTSVTAPPAVPSRPEQPLRLFTLCRLVARKNVTQAVRVVAGLVNQGHDIEYDVAGVGPELDAIVQLVAETETAAKIHVHGHISTAQVDEMYQRSHVFLHPHVDGANGSDIEGFGIAIADAMAHGCVPIVGQSGGPRDYVTSGVNGLVVDGRSDAQISTAVSTLFEGRSRREALARAAREHAATHLTWDAHVRTILDQLAGTPAAEPARRPRR